MKFYCIQANDDVKSNSINCHVLVACTYNSTVFRTFYGIGI